MEDLQGALGRQALAECAPKVEAPRKSPKRERESECSSLKPGGERELGEATKPGASH